MFGKISAIDKPLVQLNKGKNKEKMQVTNLKNERKNISTSPIGIKRITRS